MIYYLSVVLRTYAVFQHEKCFESLMPSLIYIPPYNYFTCNHCTYQIVMIFRNQSRTRQSKKEQDLILSHNWAYLFPHAYMYYSWVKTNNPQPSESEYVCKFLQLILSIPGVGQAEISKKKLNFINNYPSSLS